MSNPVANLFFNTSSVGSAGGTYEFATLRVVAITLTATEGTTMSFKIIREGNRTNEVSVSWIAIGANYPSITPEDFPTNALPTGTETFEPGQTERVVTFATSDDADIEPNEAFKILLYSPSPGAVIIGGFTSGILYDNDGSANAILGVTAIAMDRTEGQTFQAQATRTGSTTSAVSCNWTLEDIDPAVFGGTLPSGILSWAAGNSTPQDISFASIDDAIDRNDLTFRLVLSSPSVGAEISESNGWIGGILRDNDSGGGTVSLTMPNRELVPDTTAIVEVPATITKGGSANVEVGWQVQPATLTSTIDPLSGADFAQIVDLPVAPQSAFDAAWEVIKRSDGVADAQVGAGFLGLYGGVDDNDSVGVTTKVQFSGKAVIQLMYMPLESNAEAGGVFSQIYFVRGLGSNPSNIASFTSNDYSPNDNSILGIWRGIRASFDTKVESEDLANEIRLRALQDNGTASANLTVVGSEQKVVFPRNVWSTIRMFLDPTAGRIDVDVYIGSSNVPIRITFVDPLITTYLAGLWNIVVTASDDRRSQIAGVRVWQATAASALPSGTVTFSGSETSKAISLWLMPRSTPPAKERRGTLALVNAVGGVIDPGFVPPVLYMTTALTPPPPPPSSFFRNPRMTKADGVTPKQIIDCPTSGDWTTARNAFKAGTYNSVNQAIKLRARLTGGVTIDWSGTEAHPMVIFDDQPADPINFSGRGGWTGAGTVTGNWVWLHQLWLYEPTMSRIAIEVNDQRPAITVRCRGDNMFITACKLQAQQSVKWDAGDSDVGQFSRIGFNWLAGDTVELEGKGANAIQCQQAIFAKFASSGRNPKGNHYYKNWCYSDGAPIRDGDWFYHGDGTPTGAISGTYNYKTYNWPNIMMDGGSIQDCYGERGRSGFIYMKHPPPLIKRCHCNIPTAYQSILVRGQHPHAVRLESNRVSDCQDASRFGLEGSEHIVIGNYSRVPFSTNPTCRNVKNAPKPLRGSDGTKLIGNSGNIELAKIAQPSDYSKISDLRDITIEAHVSGVVKNASGGTVSFSASGVATGTHPNLVTSTVVKRDNASETVDGPVTLSNTLTGPKAAGLTWGAS